MPLKLPEKQRLAIMSLDAPKRYKHFVSRVADEDAVWSLKNEEGWVALSADGGQFHFPVWPHPEYATACAQSDWAGRTATAISLTDFLEKWLPGMERDNRHVAVFPVPSSNSKNPLPQGVSVEPNRLRVDIKEALDEID